MVLTGFLCPIDGLPLLGMNSSLRSPPGRDTDLGDHVHVNIEGEATCANTHTWHVVDGPLMERRA